MVAKAGFYADRNTVSSGTIGYALRDSTSRMRWGIGMQTPETSGDVGSDFQYSAIMMMDPILQHPIS